MLRVIQTLFQLRLQWELAFRADAILGFAAQGIYILGTLLFFEVVYAQVDTIADWNRAEVLALVGTLTLLLELDLRLFRQGLQRLPALVRQGRLELYLLRPIWTPLLIALRGSDPIGLWRSALGIAVLAYALNLGIMPDLVHFLLYILSFILSLLIYVLMVFCLVCLSFWLIEMHNLFFIVYDLVEFARYPDSVYKGFIRGLFLTVLPLLILANFPVRMLLRDEGLFLLMHQILVLLGFWGLAWALWQLGLRRYQGASS
jgi:ABC-2 type transport system permease protein